ncbi:MAG: DUF4215 domain-containing protein [Proteobacteria bacterium]|nr:DUF4215 domain-containing protein [Pseudomonadota bacterium]
MNVPHAALEHGHGLAFNRGAAGRQSPARPQGAVDQHSAACHGNWIHIFDEARMRSRCRGGALGWVWAALAGAALAACGEQPVHRELADGRPSDARDLGGSFQRDGGLQPPADGRAFLTDSTIGRPCTDGAICNDAGIIIAEPSCGDGRLNQQQEACDDGNTLPGDGCSGVCALEPNALCPTPGQPCQSAIVCGDGLRAGAEVCDDSNAAGGDGCAADCAAIEPGWACPAEAGACTPLVLCGDRRINGSELCDDGNLVGGDGCAGDCLSVEPDFACPNPGQACLRIAVCGDGRRSAGEACDDGNARAGDGCTADCRAVEADFVCSTPGQACVSTIVCGDGRVSGSETCDDRNTGAGDGCSATCHVEGGWRCTVVGAPCEAAACGDGLLRGAEECEDGGQPPVSGDGCSALCRLEPGFVCASAGQPCRATVCGDGIAEGSEGCDDGNHNLGDGCTPRCQREPNCSAGACVSACGDGLRLPGDAEACDDGNTRSGDGCSATCQLEPGFRCTDAADGDGSQLVLPIVIRDFKAKGSSGGHQDFENDAYVNLLDFGIVRDQLDAVARKPVYAHGANSPRTNESTTNQTLFDQWYRDVAGVNQTEVQNLTLTRQANGSYVFHDATFFPIDGRLFGNQGRSHNFHFTSEVRYWFEYKGNEVLEFIGDDDVWVFVKGQLAVDLGGVHGQDWGEVTLDAAAATRFGLQVGKVYEIAIFQAERHTTQSNYKLTLGNFTRVRTQCTAVCGDGIVTRLEACDDGKNDGSYGSCLPGCVGRAPYCGDGLLQAAAGEQCDDGVNTSTYGACAPGCKLAARCGDGAVAAAFGEQCDDGSNDGGYGQCAAGCLLGTRCGDGIPQPADGEQCDDGLNDGGYAQCAPGCVLGARCGDGLVQTASGEQCDDGSNDGGYGQCAAGCRLGARCGDGLVQTASGEQCDDGSNDGGYGQCAAGCRVGARCGDGQVQAASGEQCDDGSNDGGYGQCFAGCRLGLRCGDGLIQSADGEQCDDGNARGGDGCSATCRQEIIIY